MTDIQYKFPKPSNTPYNPYAPVPINSKLYKPYVKNGQLPIVYRDEYNHYFTNSNEEKDITYMKDASIAKEIIEKLNLSQSTFVSPNLPTNEDFRLVHSNRTLYQFTLIGKVFYKQLLSEGINMNVDQSQFSKSYLNGEKYKTSGSILAGKLAMQYGWSINIGGGFNTSTEHCYEKPPNAFHLGIGAIYADVTLLVHYLFAHFPERVKKVMIIDLDACPGYGIKCDFVDRPDVFVLDVFNGKSYQDLNIKMSPSIRSVKAFTSTDMDANPFFANFLTSLFENDEEKTTDKENDYLNLVEDQVKSSLNEFLPDIVVYIAGTNILKNPYDGGFSISKRGLLRRDEIVFENVRRRERNIPIVMLMGAQCPRRYNSVYADSINNLKCKGFFKPIWN